MADSSLSTFRPCTFPSCHPAFLQSCNARERSELRRPRAVEHRAGDREVVELDAVAGVAQQQAAARHVAAADEGDRKLQALAEDVAEHRHVLRRRDAAEQDDVAVETDLGGQRARARFKWPAILRVVRVDVTAAKARRRVRDERIGKPAARRSRDDMNPAADDRIRGIGRYGEPRA